MPDATGFELVRQSLNQDLGADAVRSTEFHRGRGALIADPARIVEVLRWLKETPGQEYSFCASVHGCDYLPAQPRFGVHYELLNMPRVERISVKALLGDPGFPDLPEIETVSGLFPTADFQEREVYDFFGVVFNGHPDLRRSHMPEDYVGHPQRRDFPVGGDPVLYTYNEGESPGWFA
jgi:NADH-quinone oxidoreductase subunit C